MADSGEDRKAKPIGGFNQGFSASGPSVRANATVAGALIPSVSFLIYGQVGPRFDLSTGIKLSAATLEDPWWRITAPVSLTAQLSVPHYEKLSSGKLTVFSQEFAVDSVSR